MRQHLQILFWLILPACAAGQLRQAVVHAGAFPASLQLSTDSAYARWDTAAVHAALRGVVAHGFSRLWVRDSGVGQFPSLLRYAASLGMGIDWMTSGLEGFGRYRPPQISVYAPGYADAVKKRVRDALAPVRHFPAPACVFPFHDEPFHAGPESFDYSSYAKAAFKKRYGYPMPVPDSVGALPPNPEKRLDLLNFQSRTFSEGWRKTYRIVKSFLPRAKVVMTHDSHNCFGAGVHSNSKVAMDDVFHWGGGFADVYVYDIYPYLTFDYRYGDFGKLPRPRISQMHYTIAQMRDLTTAYHKELGFWVGTYNKLWFDRFRGPERKRTYWSEREMAFTAIAQGADFLISPSAYRGANLPMDSTHWADFGAAMREVQQASPGLLQTSRVKARACFLFPRTQYLLLQQEYYNVGLSFELFLRAFGELDMLHEDQVTDASLDGYKVLVLCDVQLLPEAVARHIRAFVRRGGIVIADCLPQLDEKEQPLQVMKKLFGVREGGTGRILRQGQWVPFTQLPPKMSFPPPAGWQPARTGRDSVSDTVSNRAFGRGYRFGVVSPRALVPGKGRVLLRMRSGEPALISHKAGRGKAYLFGFCLQDTYFATWKDGDTAGRAALRGLVSAVFRDAGVRSHVYSSNPDIEASLRANGREGYLFVINHESTDPDTRVRLEAGFRIGKITDVATGRAVDFSRQKDGVWLDLNVPFGSTRLLALKAGSEGGRDRSPAER